MKVVRFLRSAGKERWRPATSDQRPATSEQGERGKRKEEREKQVPPLRGPTRHKSARRKKSGRSGPFDFAQGRRDDRFWDICFVGGQSPFTRFGVSNPQYLLTVGK